MSLLDSVFPPSNALLLAYLKTLLKEILTMSETQQQTAARLALIEGQLGKGLAEIVAEIATLKAAVEGAATTDPEIVASTDRLAVLAQAIDDVVKDAPPAEG